MGESAFVDVWLGGIRCSWHHVLFALLAFRVWLFAIDVVQAGADLDRCHALICSAFTDAGQGVPLRPLATSSRKHRPRYRRTASRSKPCFLPGRSWKNAMLNEVHGCISTESCFATSPETKGLARSTGPRSFTLQHRLGPPAVHKITTWSALPLALISQPLNRQEECVLVNTDHASTKTVKRPRLQAAHTNQQRIQSTAKHQIRSRLH